MLTYFRTGQYYLNRGGRYADVFPEVLKLSDGRYYTDYGYHVAPIAAAHLDEMEALATLHGVPSFKIFMFYGGYGLHGKAGEDEQRRVLMIGPEGQYDLAHLAVVIPPAATIGAPADGRRGQRASDRGDARPPQRLHADRPEGRFAAGPRRLQRGAPAARRGPCGRGGVVSRPRDRLRQRQPAAPLVAQGARERA